ncbi:MAG: GGDEF domain-containing protein [Candidatus Sericytochromatia bacterium]
MSTPPATRDLPDLRLLDFESACQEVLDFLHKRLGFGLWMVTRQVGDEWIVLQAKNQAYTIQRGDVLSGPGPANAFVVNGDGPRLTHLQQPLPVQAYMGVPLTDGEGRVFGSLCALDPDPQSETLLMEQPLIELLAALLSAILKLELSALEAQRRNERLEMDAQIDALTELANQRAWAQLVHKEEERCLRYGHSAAIVVVNLNDFKAVNASAGKAAGDALLLRVVDALRAATREVDLLARLGGDTFGVLAVECSEVGSLSLLKRIQQTLETRQIQASVGIAARHATGGLTTAWEMAERRMYEQKRSL